MSWEMIPRGVYWISNLRYKTDMPARQETRTSSATTPVTRDQHLATLYDIYANLYLGIDQINAKAKGYTDPQVLQLSSDDGIKFTIHTKNADKVWVLKDGGNSTPITVEPAPASDEKYWEFTEVPGH
ncbi:hypothetical protein F4604DRAFT_1680791 [Suillus subluteus]|nr:hypothetical protein F4604DRAFT_1680791 [Suillus subluteus]